MKRARMMRPSETSASPLTGGDLVAPILPQRSRRSLHRCGVCGCAVGRSVATPGDESGTPLRSVPPPLLCGLFVAGVVRRVRHEGGLSVVIRC